MKKIKYLIILILGLSFVNCNNWLDILPDNEQPSKEYWKSKEDVESVISSGYYYLRECTPYLIDWGELRGASLGLGTFDTQKFKLYSFDLTAENKLVKWESFYQVINMANSVIKFADVAKGNDPTYSEGAMNSHKTEAYFMRALSYFFLLRNFKEVPLILTPYVDDSTPYNIAKSTDKDIIAQIKEDIKIALDTDAAKESYEIAWQNKGRSTKWSLYALMADVALWNEDYDECIHYADLLIKATAPIRPVFISDPTKWFEIFNPGNSNESIFELNWDYSNYQEDKNSPSKFLNLALESKYRFRGPMLERLIAETVEVGATNAIRSYYGTFANSSADYLQYDVAFVWKYMGTGYQDFTATRTNQDANFIIYRMADIMLLKAEALILKGESSWTEALGIINQVRVRSNLSLKTVSLTEATELDMLLILLNERDMEFASEGKRWYDLLRFGKAKEYKYKEDFIRIIEENNTEKSPNWLRSVLKNENAWYLPIHVDEIFSNKLLEQNPYYKVTTN